MPFIKQRLTIADGCNVDKNFFGHKAAFFRVFHNNLQQWLCSLAQSWQILGRLANCMSKPWVVLSYSSSSPSPDNLNTQAQRELFRLVGFGS